MKWKAQYDLESGLWEVVGADGEIICTLWGTEPEAEDIAKMIASAPDLKQSIDSVRDVVIDVARRVLEMQREKQ